MSRRGMYKTRVIVPDPVYNDVKVAKFINILMFDGKKAVAEKILYKSMQTAKDKLGIEPLEIFYKAIENARPFAEVRSRRVGGATYQVPIDVKDERSWVLGMRFIILASRKKAGSGMAESLAEEFMDAYDNKGSAVKVKEEKHKVAEANRAFAQFRW